MRNVLKYKGYHTKVECNIETKKIYGKIEGIKDLVNFECDTFEDVEREFYQAVDDYLIFCEELGEEPNKEYRGSFNVRITPSEHRKLALFTDKRGLTLNQGVQQAIGMYLAEEGIPAAQFKNFVVEHIVAQNATRTASSIINRNKDIRPRYIANVNRF